MDVLIVDDSEASLRILERLISECGHRVVGAARDGADAVVQFERLKPDLILMDLIMPYMNGLEALRAIRALDPEARVVLTSSARSSDAALESERLGARYFLYKPFQEASLKHVMALLSQETGTAG